jgi:hypothetical protein
MTEPALLRKSRRAIFYILYYSSVKEHVFFWRVVLKRVFVSRVNCLIFIEVDFIRVPYTKVILNAIFSTLTMAKQGVLMGTHFFPQQELK